MKTIFKLKIVSILLLSLYLSSCFEDKGNYDYRELSALEIDTVGTDIRPEMTAFQFENFKVPVNIKYEGDMSNLSYEWKLYPQSPQKDDDVPLYDDPIILSTKAVLDTVIYNTPGKYYLTLTIEDKLEDIKHYLRIKLNIETKLSRGLCVMDEKDGKYDLSMIRTSKLLTGANPEDDKIYYFVFSNVNSDEVTNGKFLGYASRINAFYFFTETGGLKLNANTFEVISNDYKSFYSFPMSIKGAPMAFMETSRPMQMIVDNGLVYAWDHMTMGTTTFSDRLGGDYIAAPFLPRISTSKFSTVIFDVKKKRFAPIGQFGSSVGEFPSTSSAAFDLNNVGASKEIMFMDNGFNQYTYAVFNDTQTSDFELYITDFSGSEAMPIAIHNMENCPAINEESHYTFANRGNICFYSSGSSIYQYKYASTNTAEVVHSFSGETITSLEVFKQAGHEMDGKLLIVSTLNNGNGKVYLIEFNELNGTIVGGTEKPYEGFGRIVDILIKQ